MKSRRQRLDVATQCSQLPVPPMQSASGSPRPNTARQFRPGRRRRVPRSGASISAMNLAGVLLREIHACKMLCLPKAHASQVIGSNREASPSQRHLPGLISHRASPVRLSPSNCWRWSRPCTTLVRGCRIASRCGTPSQSLRESSMQRASTTASSSATPRRRPCRASIGLAGIAESTIGPCAISQTTTTGRRKLAIGNDHLGSMKLWQAQHFCTHEFPATNASQIHRRD